MPRTGGLHTQPAACPFLPLPPCSFHPFWWEIFVCPSLSLTSEQTLVPRPEGLLQAPRPTNKPHDERF